jgi:hypothetical protein
MSSEGASPPAGWYSDPQNPYVQRWWNGSAWTEDTAVRPSVPPPGAGYRGSAYPVARKNSAATWGFVLSLVSIPAWMLGGGPGFVLGPILSILIAVAAVVLGGIGLARSRRYGRGFGLALAAVIIGTFQAFGGVLLLLFLSAVGSGGPAGI